VVDISGAGVMAGETEQCMEGVRVVAILSWRLEGVRIFLDLSVGICTARVSIDAWSGGDITYDLCACQNLWFGESEFQSRKLVLPSHS
jgi:hypothetical protein